ncbi:MAG: glycosyltransferase [Gemmatimonadales bacterium]
MNRSGGSDTGRVLFLQYANPAAYPPVVSASRLLAKAGWRVRILDPGSRDTESISFPPEEGVDVVSLAYVPPGWRQKVHYVRYGISALRTAATWKPQWIYGSDFIVTPILRCLGLLTGIRIIYHEHDTPSASQSSFFLNFCMRARRAVARGAAAVVVPNRERAAAVEADLGITPPLLVWNCPTREEVSDDPAQSHDGLRLLYHGSINDSRVPMTLIQALALAGDSVTMTIVGYETIHSRGYSEALRREAERLGVSGRVTVLPSRNRESLESLRLQHDVGIAIVTSAPADLNLAHLAGASCKVFEYMSAAMVPLVSATNDWKTDFIDPGLAIGCDPGSAESIASAIQWLREHPLERREMGARARERIADEWNYETQFAPVMSLLDRVMDGTENDA